jgi:branched-chain amino acid transport system permease protein
MNPLTQAIFSGLMAGAVYALLASGLVLIYRTSRVLNLAHGETYAVSAVVASLVSTNGGSAVLAIPAGLAAAVMYSAAVDQFLLKPRRDWPVPSLILITLAAAFLTRGVLLLVGGIDPVSPRRSR